MSYDHCLILDLLSGYVRAILETYDGSIKPNILRISYKCCYDYSGLFDLAYMCRSNAVWI